MALEYEGLDALIEAIHKTGEAQQLTLVDSRDGKNPVPVVVLPKDRRIESIKHLVDEYLIKPERIQSKDTLQDIESFVAHVNRFKLDETALFANRSMSEPSISAIYDFHWHQQKVAVTSAEGGDKPDLVKENMPEWGEHRAIYRFPLSEEWKIWMAQNKRPMDQGAFAIFIEDRIIDLIAPPLKKEDGALYDLIQTLGIAAAPPNKMIEISRGIQIHVKDKVEQAFTTASGEVSFQYKTEHQNAAGKPIVVPSLFAIAIPVFESGPLYRMLVRLRYRLKEGDLSWHIELFQPDKTFRHAFEEGCVQASVQTGAPLFYGVA